MAESSRAASDGIVAIDIGATSIKIGVVNDVGELIGEIRSIATPYPCTPERLVNTVVDEIEMTECARVGIGFPGDLDEGRVMEPGNLSRVAGISSDVSPAIEQSWQGFELQEAFRQACARDVRVVNDATLAALGYATGDGRELTFTLGTGLGIALVVDGARVKIRDVGAEIFMGGRSYDEVLGEPSRATDQRQWCDSLLAAVNGFVAEFDARAVHLGGGNARYVDLALFDTAPYEVAINDNEGTLRGAAKLFARD